MNNDEGVKLMLYMPQFEHLKDKITYIIPELHSVHQIDMIRIRPKI